MIKQIAFPVSQYMQEEHPKKQIYLHHTAGGPSAENVFNDWSRNPERIATCVVISGTGQIVQGFSSKFWAYHLGLKEATFDSMGIPYQSLDRISVGIEVCNWGQLRREGTKFFNYVGGEVLKNEVTRLDKPFKGYEYFHSYTDKQIESVKELLLLWKDKYKIDIKYNPDIFDITTRALRGENGVYTHNSVRRDKVDMYPCPRLINMLKTLK